MVSHRTPFILKSISFFVKTKNAENKKNNLVQQGFTGNNQAILCGNRLIISTNNMYVNFSPRINILYNEITMNRY